MATKEDIVMPVPAGAPVDDKNEEKTPFDMIVFTLFDKKGDKELEGFLAMEQGSEFLDVHIVDKDRPHTVIRTYVSNLFPFDPATIRDYIKHVFKSASEGIKDGSVEATVDKENGNIALRPKKANNKMASKPKKEDDEDIRW